MDSPMNFCGRQVTDAELKLICEVVKRHAGLSRMDREHLKEGSAPKAVWVYALKPNAAQRLREPS